MQNTTLILLASLGLLLAACPPADDTTTPDTADEAVAEEGAGEGEEGGCPHAREHGGHHDGHHGGPHAEGHSSPFQTEGVNAAVENLDNGVTLTFTSEDAEKVSELQEHVAKKGEEGGEGCSCDCPCKWEGVTRATENLDNGVTVTLTAEDAELVTKVQEHVAKMAAGEAEGCGGHGEAKAEGCGHGKGEHPWAVLYSDQVTRTAENLDNGVKMLFTAGCPHLQGELETAAAAKVAHMAAKGEDESKCQCPFHDEGVTAVVEEIENGTALVYTADNAEKVTELQEYAAKKVSGESGCGCGKHGEEAEAVEEPEAA